MTVRKADAHFDRLSILVVEDNRFVRELMETVLRHLGFGWVATAANGQEAIEFLQLVKNNPTNAGVMSVDMILTDLIMSPINGLLLLQWIRSNKNSPDRMIPVIMISGAADYEHVKAARDVGMTEFCAKPFSAESVGQKILQVINAPRQFVASHTYFGPDRRRRDDGWRGKTDFERRIFDEKTATIVYSKDNVKRPKKGSDVWYFRLPNSLKEKMGAGAALNMKMELPSKILEVAEKELQRSAMDFADWANQYLAQLSQLTTDAFMKPAARKGIFEEINKLGHELRGQGGTFGYPLITVLAKSLYESTGAGVKIKDSSVEIVKTHVDAMKAVLRDRIKGDGGELGKELLKSLEVAIEKHQNPKVK